MRLTVVINFVSGGCGLEYNNSSDWHPVSDDNDDDDDDDDAFLEDWFQLGPEDVSFSSYVFLEMTFQHAAVPALTSCVLVIWLWGCTGEIEEGEQNYIEGVHKY